jgi:hypothetical protein
MLIAQFSGTPEIKSPLSKINNNNHNHKIASANSSYSKSPPTRIHAFTHNEPMRMMKSKATNSAALEEQFKAACDAIQNLPKNGS